MDEILEADTRLRDSDRRLAWLPAALEAIGGDVARGLLVSVGDTPEQDGWLVHGTWLTYDRRFWDFVAVVPWRDNEPVVVEKFEDATDDVPVSPHRSGTGKSFGYLALEALDRRLLSDNEGS